MLTRFTLPAESQTSPEIRREAETVWLAEDDREMRALVAEMLRSAGFDVWAVSDGAELLEQLESSPPEEHPNLVVSDHHMPGVQGLQALDVVRRRHPELPFILITAFGDHETHAKARALGAFAVLDKPVDFDRLCEAAAEAVTRFEE